MNFANVKSVTIPEGAVTKIVAAGKTLWELIVETYKNWVKYSIETNGSIYNNGAGCMYGWRLNSSGAVKEQAGANHTGYIPVKHGDVVRSKGATVAVGNSANYFTIYDASFNRLRTDTFTNCASTNYYASTYVQQSDGLYMFTLDTGKAGATTLSAMKNAAYFRMSMGGCATEDFIVTVNEEIT